MCHPPITFFPKNHPSNVRHLIWYFLIMLNWMRMRPPLGRSLSPFESYGRFRKWVFTIRHIHSNVAFLMLIPFSKFANSNLPFLQNYLLIYGIKVANHLNNEAHCNNLQHLPLSIRNFKQKTGHCASFQGFGRKQERWTNKRTALLKQDG